MAWAEQMPSNSATAGSTRPDTFWTTSANFTIFQPGQLTLQSPWQCPDNLVGRHADRLLRVVLPNLVVQPICAISGFRFFFYSGHRIVEQWNEFFND
jgi:hypothetical protein